MRPLTDWIDDAARLARPDFCKVHPGPFLVHWVAQSVPVKNTAIRTIERLVVDRPRTGSARALIESYQVGIVHTTRASKEVWLGSSTQCDVVVDDSSVSRVHAYLVWKSGSWRLLDAESATGTLINDEPLRLDPLAPGDRITLGTVDLLFLDSPQLYTLVHRLGLFSNT